MTIQKVEMLPIESLPQIVDDVVQSQEIIDIHTHLFAPAFGKLLLWGIDELLTYHYLIAETFRRSSVTYDQFWSTPKSGQADLIWQTLFINNSPLSEACRGVITTLKMLGLDLSSRNLQGYRDYFTDLSVDDFVNQAFRLANVKSVVMTNDPFDPVEREVWETYQADDDRFLAALRIDPLLNDYGNTGIETLQTLGYDVDGTLALSKQASRQVRRFLSDWIERIQPKYMAVSLPPTFRYPEDSIRGQMIQECILPISRQYNLPWALMIGVTRAVNPQLRLAGDGVGKVDLTCLENLLRENPDNKFLTTVLSRENQHELCVLARKFPNLMIFGCWWFVNNPSIIQEITQERLELLGLSIIPQHSDARIMDQLIYKWTHSRQIISSVLTEKYKDLINSGWELTRLEIERDVAALLSENFTTFLE
ncbi:MAG: glucuronate isomerase [Candidatus Poribacteria bacterium]|jgi:hypothetical protein|nr:glucuronate isomerase [Candidatus Poribacteria bacterium]MDP6749838.1 glucuronate isomerase [Candidatus Poribacteria bacterium]MDP6995176.1 glucuronate isomerase [Candidatus Poribacteria bacterium]